MRKKRKEAIEKLDEITAIALKRGFFWPTAEIYGGKSGLLTYGHLGKAMKNKFENLWRKHFIKTNENYYEIESAVILPETVFIASGHLEHFNDPLVECKTCHYRFRADKFIEDNLKINAEELTIKKMSDLIRKNKLKCPKCGSWHLSEVKWFNMMFPIQLGTVGVKDLAYLTPETAQASYLAFKREFDATRKKLPLGLAIIGKAFRNEISPRQLITRMKEFHQAELQIFFDPEKIDECGEWESIESKKIKVIEIEEENKFDGLSVLIDNKYPVIVINKSFPVERKRFTLLHELGHLLLNINERFSDKDEEMFCNRFAGALLLPEEAVYENFGTDRKNISFPELKNIQELYGISIRAIMYRLKDLVVISAGMHKGFSIRLNSDSLLKNEVDEVRFTEQENTGRYNRLVYQALSKELISLSKASSLLGVAVNKVKEEFALI